MMLVVVMALALQPFGASAKLHHTIEHVDLGTLNATGAYLPRPPRLSELSKKALWLEEKALRPNVRVPDAKLSAAKRASTRVPQPPLDLAALPPPGTRIEPITTLFSLRLKEAVPVLPGRSLTAAFRLLLRDHYTNDNIEVDPELLGAITRAAIKFSSPRVEVVSGYRSPKYNLSLRKKGRQVAQSSQHCEGRAVDFRLRGVPTKDLWKFIRGLKLGGVGFYPHSRFVHCDTGPVRFWNGE